MYEVVNAKKMGGAIVKYTIKDLETEQFAEVRPPQLENFCILRSFTNAIAKKDCLVADRDGFEVIEIDSLSVEERKERAIMFVEELIETSISVTGYERGYRGESPRDYLLSALGQTGKISVYPGTEYFNKGILSKLHFENVELGENTSINPSHGFTDRYEGWVGHNIPCKNSISDVKDYFTIEHSPYSYPEYLSKAGIDTHNLFYTVRIKGNMDCLVWITKENKIAYVTAFKH